MNPIMTQTKQSIPPDTNSLKAGAPLNAEITMTEPQTLATIALMATLIQRCAESALDADRQPDEEGLKAIARMTVAAMQAGCEALNRANSPSSQG